MSDIESNSHPSPTSIPPTDGSATTNTLPISETFVSIQGEGALIGTPSWFARVSGCNLRCAWCDTPYASWRPEGRSRSVLDLAREAASSGVRHAVLTGGEPMLFPAIEHLAAELRAIGMHITVETAGTVFRVLACDLMSISPKLSNSTPTSAQAIALGGTSAEAWVARHEQARLNTPVLQILIRAFADVQFKFVVQSASDIAEIDSLLATLTQWRQERIFLMPEGVSEPASDHREMVIQACQARNWRYGHRLHITLFGNRRGT